MNYIYIEQLLTRYFDATTTTAEERILKAFFSQHDVPAHLLPYAGLFAYEDTEAQSAPLSADFDARVLARLEADGDAPVVRVKIQRLTIADRLRPLYRAAAAVAIVVLVGGSMHRAYETHTFEPIGQYGPVEAVNDGVSDQNIEPASSLFKQEGKKVAITTDTIGTNVKTE